MNDMITLRGIVGTQPDHRVTGTGLPVTDFRLASGQRKLDPATGTWVSTDTNWYTVSAYRQLALNIRASLNKGEHVVVTGRLRVKTWEKDGRKGTMVEVDADAVGHDLRWCTTSAVPTVRTGLGPAVGASSPPGSSDTGGGELAGSSGFGAQRAFDEAAEFDETAGTGGDTEISEFDDADEHADGFLPSGSGGFATLDS